MVGAGKGEGAMDAGNMLKPALARGELHCVGATTLDEYRKYIEKTLRWSAASRKSWWGEPTVEDTIAILRGLQEKYEVHHGVEITDPAIVAAAELSNRYITDRFLPDKAIDLIDEASGQDQDRNRLQARSHRTSLDRRMIQLADRARGREEGKGRGLTKRLTLLEEEIEKLQKEIADLEDIWKSEKPSAQGSQQVREQVRKVKQIEEPSARAISTRWPSCNTASCLTWSASSKEAQAKEEGRRRVHPNRLLRTQVGAEEIAEVVSRATGIPSPR